MMLIPLTEVGNLREEGHFHKESIFLIISEYNCITSLITLGLFEKGK